METFDIKAHKALDAAARALQADSDFEVARTRALMGIGWALLSIADQLHSMNEKASR